MKSQRVFDRLSSAALLTSPTGSGASERITGGRVKAVRCQSRDSRLLRERWCVRCEERAGHSRKIDIRRKPRDLYPAVIPAVTKLCASCLLRFSLKLARHFFAYYYYFYISGPDLINLLDVQHLENLTDSLENYSVVVVERSTFEQR